jgi:hypothetical protein
VHQTNIPLIFINGEATYKLLLYYYYYYFYFYYIAGDAPHVNCKNVNRRRGRVARSVSKQFMVNASLKFKPENGNVT